MSSNKEYRKHEYGEDIMEALSDIVDYCDDAKDNVRYLENLEEVVTMLVEARKKIDFIIEKINLKEGNNNGK